MLAQLFTAVLHWYPQAGQDSNPGKPDFFRSCISCVLICDDLLCMQFLSFYNNLSAS